ncbi:MAG TPA: hypothetical protein VFZ69_10915 [Longimicrobiales bacterium]
MKRCIAAFVAPALAVCTLAACASTPAAAPPAAPTLAYVLPPVNPADYVFTDTTAIVTEAPGRVVDTRIEVATRVTVGFHVDSAGMLASVRIAEVAGQVQSDGKQLAGADSAAVPADVALLRLTAAGVDTLTHAPYMRPGLARILGGDSFFHGFFVRLPGMQIEPGVAWTDTLALTDEAGGLTSTTRSIVSSSLQGDTTIDGRIVRVIASRIALTISVRGVVDGSRVEQELTGTADATTFWDDERGLLVWREERGTASGTMTLPELGLTGLPVRATAHRTLSLVQ